MTENARIKVGLFKSAGNFRSYRAGEIIFNEGETGHEMFAVRTGRVALRIGDQVVSEVEEDETFGEMALIDQRPRSATAVAVTDCEIVPVDEKRFLFLVQQTPNFAVLMLKILASRLRTMDSSFGRK